MLGIKIWTASTASGCCWCKNGVGWEQTAVYSERKVALAIVISKWSTFGWLWDKVRWSSLSTIGQSGRCHKTWSPQTFSCASPIKMKWARVAQEKQLGKCALKKHWARKGELAGKELKENLKRKKFHALVALGYISLPVFWCESLILVCRLCLFNIPFLPLRVLLFLIKWEEKDVYIFGN